MTNPYIWAGLQRATNDPTTIDEAIGEAIAAHQDDPDAHLGPGEALESHRASEIIDHRAESIVNDKIRGIARRYIAIVDPNDPYSFDTVQEACNYASSVGGGDILVQRGTHYIESPLRLVPTCSLYGFGQGETILSFDNSDVDAIYIQGFGDRSIAYLGNAVAVTGTNYVDFTSTSNPEGYSLVGSMLDIRDGTSVVYRQILEVISGTRVRVSGAALTAGAAMTSSVVVALKFTNGNNYVKYESDPASFSRCIIPGFTLYDTTYSVATMIVSTNGVDGFYINDAATGTGVASVDLVYTDNRMTYSIESLTAKCYTGSTFIYDESERCHGYITECEVLDARRLGWFTEYGVSVERCRISLVSNWVLTTGGMNVFKDSDINFNSAMGTDGACYQGTLFDNCRFNSGGSGNVDILAYVQAGGIIRNCKTQRQKSSTFVGDNGASVIHDVIISGNTFGMYASQALQFAGRGVRFVDNYINGTTSATVLATGSQFNIMTGNLSDGAFTNSGTNNILANNQTY